MADELVTSEATPVETPVASQETAPVEAPAAEPAETPEWEQYTLPEEKDDEPAAEPVKPEQPALDFKSEYVKSPEQVTQAVADADFLYDVVNGKQSAASLIQAVAQTNPQAAQRIISELIPLIEQVTGKKLGGEQQADPVQERLNSLDKQQRDFVEQQKQEAFNRRSQAATRTVAQHLQGTLKDSIYEGREAELIPRVVDRLKKAGITEEQAVTMIEQGNFTAINKAVKELRKEKIARYNADVKRVSDLRKRTANAVPSTNGSGAGQQRVSQKYTPETLKDEKVRSQYMNDVMAGKVQPIA